MAGSISPIQKASRCHIQGLQLVREGNTEMGVTLLRESIRLAPHIPDFHSNLAAVLGQLGRHAEAIEALERAVELKPDHAKAHHNLGIACERLDRLDDAEAEFRKAVEIDPITRERGLIWRACFKR